MPTENPDGKVINGKYSGKLIYKWWEEGQKGVSLMIHDGVLETGLFSSPLSAKLFNISSKTIVDYQLTGSLTQQANPGDVLIGGFWFGAAGAMAASAAGSSTHNMVVIEYPDGERSLIDLFPSAYTTFQSIAFEIDERKRKGISFEEANKPPKPHLDEWYCSKCHKWNKKYIGTCNCGNRRPR